MLPLGIAIFGTVLGAIGLIMSFSTSGKVTKLQNDLGQAQSDITDVKAAAASAAGLSAKVNDAAGKIDAVENYISTTVAKGFADDRTAINDLTDKVSKLSTAKTATAASAKGGAAATHVVAGQGGTVQISSGETLSVLAKKYNVTVKAIEDANPGVDPNHLKIGQEITIPGSKPAASSSAAPAASGTPVTAVSTGN